MKNVLAFRPALALFCFFSCFLSQTHAQIAPTLSVQGILKKANGVAVDDGTYSLTFKLYTQETGGTAVWTETQTNVEVSSGIYSATLGTVSPLNVAFTQLYYLGVTVGTTELTPRVLLTSAPYALSLIGQSNKFPSSGGVRADSVRVATNLVVNGNFPTTHSVVAVGGYLARGGAPGANGANNNGYAFEGNGGDKDSGLFSTGDGNVSLYVNNNPVLAAGTSGITVSGTAAANGVAVNNNGSVSYNGLNDWRLVELDYFDSDAEGWQAYDVLSGQQLGWNNPNPSGAAPRIDLGNFIGNILLPNDNNQVLKKQFNIPGSFTQIKVRFRFFFIDSWDFGDAEKAWAAFSTNSSGNGLRVGWQTMYSRLNSNNGRFDAGSPTFSSQANFLGNNTWIDNWMDAEMTGKSTGSSFWVFIGAAMDHGGVNDERWGLGAVEIYVR